MGPFSLWVSLRNLTNFNFCLPKTKGITVCSYHVAYEFQNESTLSSLPECQGTSCAISDVYVTATGFEPTTT